MRKTRVVPAVVAAIAFVSLSALARAQDSFPIGSATKGAGGVRLHYLVAGKGPALILLHGYAETSRMWRPIIPKLAERFSVIAPDLPGIGDSDVPQGAVVDMKWAAARVHDLVRSLGVQSAEVVGHDIGLMVAYAYAAQYPSEVTKLVLMDAFLPGVAGWEAIYDNPDLWHFRFHGETPLKLVQGREAEYFAYYWNEFAADRNRSLPPADREAYVAAYSRPGRMAAGWAYFASFPKTAHDFAELAKTKLKIPVLSIGGDKSLGEALGKQARLISDDVTVVVLKNAGHWILEEQPEETTAALLEFL
ncbi:MAG TPA: alpha/beta hydrolase [Thermoanaerobaculia bacterium]|jgi:pimeloyl-ACP methyl ester carboxylesterase|nr:alpha/beta hydrolase [Thermoanaerobaculia bacterium]